jgi:hypothetical protein
MRGRPRLSRQFHCGATVDPVARMILRAAERVVGRHAGAAAGSDIPVRKQIESPPIVAAQTPSLPALAAA